MPSKTSGLVATIFKFPRITRVAVNNANKVAYSTFILKSKAQKKYWQYQLWLQENSAKKRVLLQSKDLISSPVWSHDGNKLAYLVKNSNQAAIWIYDSVTKRQYELFSCKQDIIVFKWSPNDQQIAFAAQDLDYQPITGRDRPIEITEYHVNVRLYLIATRKQSKAQFKALTPADFSLGYELNSACFDWSPDGKKIVFAFQAAQGMDFVMQSKIGILNLVTGKVTVIPYTQNKPGISPVFSPDGKWIAFAGALPIIGHDKKRVNEIVQNCQICVTEVKRLQHTYSLTNTPNEHPSIIGWNKSSDGIFVWDNFKTQGPQIYLLSLKPKLTTKLIKRQRGIINAASLSLNATATTFGFAFETIENPPEVYFGRVQQHSLQLTQLSNFTKIPPKPLGKATLLNWKSKDGTLIEGLLITPPNYDSRRKYPLLVMMHGAPLAWQERYLGRCEEYGAMFDPSSCTSLILQQEYIVFQPNFRGSIGYGKEFRAANVGDWGGGDYADIMSGVDYLVKAKIADPKRMVLAGWSYGAYLTSFIIGRTNRFQAAIAGDGMSNLLSLFGTSDIPRILKKDLGGYDINLYWERSPLAHANNMQTPLLILHGKDDARVPLSQAIELCQTLLLQHKPVTMYILPHEGHIPGNPNVIWQTINIILDWISSRGL